MYAWWNGAGFDTAVVDGDGDALNVGRYSSLELDSNNFPHIAYFDETNEQLKYAYWDGGSWVFSVVDSDGRVGEFTSLALASNGDPHISYYDDGNHALKYAYVNRSISVAPPRTIILTLLPLLVQGK